MNNDWEEIRDGSSGDKDAWRKVTWIDLKDTEYEDLFLSHECNW